MFSLSFLSCRNSVLIIFPKPQKPFNSIGISAEDEGRKKYLRVRNKKHPDDKFYLKECSNWEYGWGVEQVELHKLLRIPRVQVIKQSFYRRGGTERDPDHYKNAVNMESPMFFPTL